MLKYILCFLGGAIVGIFIIAIMSGNRPDDEYRDGFKDGYEKARDEFMKLP